MRNFFIFFLMGRGGGWWLAERNFQRKIGFSEKNGENLLLGQDVKQNRRKNVINHEKLKIVPL